MPNVFEPDIQIKADAQGRKILRFGGAGPSIQTGAGDPNGVVTGALGSLYIRSDAPYGLYLNQDGLTTWGAL